jgi:hypothetical protein
LRPIDSRLQGISRKQLAARCHADLDTIALDDFKRAVDEIPSLRTPELHCAVSCFQMCCHWADCIGIRRLQLFFDRNEPFYGHISDRWRSRKARKEESARRFVSALTEADARNVCGLQIADLIAWSVSRRDEDGGVVAFDWQKALLDAHTEHQFFDYDRLKTPDLEAMDCLTSGKFHSASRLADLVVVWRNTSSRQARVISRRALAGALPDLFLFS